VISNSFETRDFCMFSRLPTAALMLGLVFSFFLPTSYAAKVYHWVDDQGRSHYSENPPRDITSKSLNVKAAGTGSTGSAAASSPSKPATKPTAEKKEKESLTVEHSPEDKAKFCQQSRTLLQQMNGNTQRRFKQADGSYRKLDQAEIADYRAQAQSGIDSYCK
jgi:hypothetical protein